MLLLLFLFARLPLFALVALDLRSILWRAVGFAVVMCIGVADVLCSRSGNGYCDYLYGFNLGVLLLDSMRHLLLMRPLEEFRHESDKVPAYQLSFIHRFFWLMKIPPRGIGWSFKVGTSHTIRSMSYRFTLGRSPHSYSSTPSHSSRIYSVTFACGCRLLLCFRGCTLVHSCQSHILHWRFDCFARLCSTMPQYFSFSWPCLRIPPMQLFLDGCSCGGYES